MLVHILKSPTLFTWGWAFSLGNFLCYYLKMTLNYCYFDGKIIPVSKARISPDDLGVLRGYGVFDFLRTYNGRPFHLKEHFVRFQNSAKKIGFKVPVSFAEVEKVIYLLLKKNKVSDGSFRLVLIGGSTTAGLQVQKPVFYILAEPVYEPTKKDITQGVKIITHEHMRYVPEAKSTNYIHAVNLQKEIRKQKAFEVLYKYGGEIYECSTCNIFLIKGKTLITPRDGILGGITRQVLLKLAKLSFKIEERPVLVSEIREVDEIFVAGTNKTVLPVVVVDDIKIGNGKVGEQTKILKALFDEYSKDN